MKRNKDAIAGDEVALGGEAGQLDLHALDRRVHETNRATYVFLPHHVPRLQGLTELKLHLLAAHPAEHGEPEFHVRGEPAFLKGQAPAPEIGHNLADVNLQEVG